MPPKDQKGGLEEKDTSRWVVFYPLYVTKSRAVCEGRKVALKDCCDKPTAKEVYQAVQGLGFECVLESDKTHPQDQGVRGRVRIRLFNDDKKPFKDTYPNKRALFRKVGRIIPELASRQSGGGSEPQTKSKKKRKGKR